MTYTLLWISTDDFGIVIQSDDIQIFFNEIWRFLAEPLLIKIIAITFRLSYL